MMHFFYAATPMPWLRWMTLASFRVHNPETPMTLHTSAVERVMPWATPERQEFMGYEGEDWWPEVESLGVEVVQEASYGAANQSADMCRWKVLAEGGTFADMDIVWLKPLPALEGDAVTREHGVYYLGLAAGKPGGVFADVLRIAGEAEPDQYQAYGVHALYTLAHGPDAFRPDGGPDWRYIRAHGGPLFFDTIIPKTWVHPFPPHHVFEQTEMPDAYGIHWFAGAAEGQEAVKSWGPETIGGGAMGEAVRRAWSRC